jgi:LCP family protein required for cell wall assembly
MTRAGGVQLPKRIIILFALTVLLAAIAGGTVAGYRYYQMYRALTQLEEKPPQAETNTPVKKEPPKLMPEPFYTFLIYGLDTGEWINDTYRDGPARADTIILLQVDMQRSNATMLSIPRDTLVQIPGRNGDDKINHAHAYGGSALLVSTVEAFTGVPVDYYIQVNYRLFKDIVDALGGVEFDVDRTISARGLTLQPGLQMLDGDQAFALVSFRKESMGDIARVERQQRFFATVARHVRNLPVQQLLRVVYSTWRHVKTDLSLNQAAELMAELHGLKPEKITKEIVPGWFYNRNGVSYWKADTEQSEETIYRLFVGPRRTTINEKSYHYKKGTIFWWK